MKDIKKMTADFFTDGDMKKAKILLEGKLVFLDNFSLSHYNKK